MNPDKAFLIPQPDLVVRDPATYEALPAEGAEKVLTSYWQRRIADGDVTVGEPKTSKKAAQPKEQA